MFNIWKVDWKMSKRTISFILSFIWIGLGTLMQISSYPRHNFLNFDYNSLIFNSLYFITFPSNILVFVLLFAEKLENIYLVLIGLQSIKIFIYWWIIYQILNRKK
ncbi:hypothetical protein EGI31_11420 [Lacihabitans soyangensis]|uniref:Uncharacterized protein n=1 Tax=Lacihabitans soyangensis TaxID=869394 RepID=A0AAE3KUV1_9BACT|nr:hypothetical protein [Lacihabitans soyangensis]